MGFSPLIKVDGQPLPQDWLNSLIEVRVERAFQVPARCTLRFVDDDYLLAQANLIKMASAIVVALPDQSAIAHVEVTGFAIEQLPSSMSELVVIAHDKSHRMARSTKVTTHNAMSYSDVVTQIIGESGLSARVTSTDRQLDYIFQVDSDLAFITEIANRVGFDWWVDDDTFIFAPPSPNSSKVTLTRGELETFSVRATGHRPDEANVVGWDSKQQETVEGSAFITSATTVPSSAFAGLVGPNKTPFGSAKVVTAGLSAGVVEEAQELGDALTSRWMASAVTAKGVTGADAKLKPGATVTIEECGPLNGDYHLTAVEHVMSGAGMFTRFTAGDRAPTSLVDTLGRSGHQDIAGNIEHGALAVGIVTNINDPDQRGRVKVRFPGLSESSESAWARLTALGGGADRGMVFIPEVNDEVLVGFESGDVRQPVVIGGLYGQKSGIPTWDVADGIVGARRITSRVGHYIELGDGDGDTKQHLLLMLKGDAHKLRLGKDRFDLELPAQKEMLIKVGDSTIEIKANGDLALAAPNINLKATADVKIEGVNVTIAATAKFAAEGKGTAELKGASVTVEGQANVAVKASGMVQIN
ncbi:MAG: hypothetical protein QOI95_365 [Acidimicrobiaceae bacterium]|jgi:uncharacterized protein involved in type VI secretion and phage assembly